MHTKVLMTVAAVSVAAGGPSVLAVDDQEDVARLQSQVAELQKTVQDLRRQVGGDDWMTEARAEEIREIVHDVLADADTRASLLQSSMNAGYDSGFYIGSADGNWKVKINGQIQSRFVWNDQDDSSADDGDGERYGFEMRRVKLGFEGHVVDPSWGYKIKGEFDRSSKDFNLDEGFIRKDFGNGGELRVGMFKGPFMREELVSSSRQLAVERSLVNEAFNQDRAEGVEYSYEGDSLRFAAMFSDGFGSDGSPALVPDTEFAVTGRVEWLVNGGWSQFKDFTSKPGSENGIMVGGAVHYEEGEDGTAFDGMELFTWTVDASVEGDGWNAYAAFVASDLETAGGPSFDMYGFVIQGGVYVTEKDEIFARYEMGDEDGMTSSEDLNVATVGWNHYYNSKVKSTVDLGYAFDAVSDFWATSGAGYREDTDEDEDGQLVIRAQLQLTF